MMKIKITKIEKVELPNYTETIFSGKKSYTRAAPLLAKYRVDLEYEGSVEKLFFEVREQPNSNPLIDEYYEDQVYGTINKVLESIRNKKTRSAAHNELLSKICLAVFNEWDGQGNELPLQYEINT